MSEILHVRLPEDLAEWLEQKCPARGDASKLVRQLLTAEQMKEAVAPLVPTEDYEIVQVGCFLMAKEDAEKAGFEFPAEPQHWSKGQLTDEEWQVLNKDQPRGLPADLHDEEGSPLPKPKARRKKSGRPDRRKQLEPSGGSPPVGATVPLPAHCNRGACTGTIKPNGRCIRCNQEPLKESK